jgi:hypothetical protein
MGNTLVASVGQQIEITLGTVGPAQYGKPEVSSAAIRLESVALGWPANPGGPTFTYIFEAAAEGQVQIKVPIINSENPEWTKQLKFAVTIRVGPAASNQPTHFVPDQVNNARWTNAWENVHSHLLETFTPSRPLLTAVEVELVLGNQGPESSEVTMMIANAEGAGLASVSKTVLAADCGHVLFRLSGGGLRVTPGQTYYIGLGWADTVFGWKYVVGGCVNGTASMSGYNGKPLLRDARCTFLFRTFGAN